MLILSPTCLSTHIPLYQWATWLFTRAVSCLKYSIPVYTVSSTVLAHTHVRNSFIICNSRVLMYNTSHYKYFKYFFFNLWNVWRLWNPWPTQNTIEYSASLVLTHKWQQCLSFNRTKNVTTFLYKFHPVENHCPTRRPMLIINLSLQKHGQVWHNLNAPIGFSTNMY